MLTWYQSTALKLMIRISKCAVTFILEKGNNPNNHFLKIVFMASKTLNRIWAQWKVFTDLLFDIFIKEVKHSSKKSFIF